MPDAPVDLEAVQKWRRTTFEQANQLCARAAIIVDFFIACLEFYKQTAPDRLKVQDAKFAAALPELHALTGAKVSSEKATAYAVKQTEAAIRAAALNFLHLAVEETVHACLTIGASLQTAKVMEWQKSKRIPVVDDKENR